MPRHYLSAFNTRQHMEAKDFEIFYYEDKILSPVSIHQHNFYEIYFFIGGNVNIFLNGKEYPMSYGDICLIPPSLNHKPVFHDNSIPYRRIVLWISPSYLDKLDKLHGDILYSFNYTAKHSKYHYSTDFSSAQLLYSKLIAIMEEYHTISPFHQALTDCCISSFLLSLNRTVYNLETPEVYGDQTTLFPKICDYIASHLEEELTLNAISNYFHVSKYYVSHLFKQYMGLSTHQYILKKRLHASKNGIHSGIPLKNVCHYYGFKDYTSFFRAFKKEFGMSPSEFKDSYSLTPSPHKPE